MNITKAIKNLDKETVSELEALDVDSLRQRVVQASQSKKIVVDELEANEAYQDLLESKKAMESSKKEVFKRQDSIIVVALSILESKGQ